MTMEKILTMGRARLRDSVEPETIKGWIEELEATVRSELDKTHEGSATLTEMFIPEVYCEIYLFYLQMKYDLLVRDTQHYVNSLAAFSAAYSDFCDRYNRENMPIGVNKITL